MSTPALHEVVVLGPHKHLTTKDRERLERDGHLGSEEFSRRDEVARFVVGPEQDWTPPPFIAMGVRTQGWMLIRRVVDSTVVDLTAAPEPEPEEQPEPEQPEEKAEQQPESEPEPEPEKKPARKKAAARRRTAKKTPAE